MKKITLIGAGSFGFTRNLVRDILSFESLSDCEICLVDINKERLEFIGEAVNRIIAAGKYKAKVTATTERKEALKDSDGVICTILQGGVDAFRHDIEIPKKYGIDINVGDTRGPSGIFRALRTVPEMLSICRDIRTYCPEALFLNYTNPMAMLCKAMQEKFPDITIMGLCHSVQGTAAMLAKWIGAPLNEITYLCAGINHLSWYLEYKWKGKDAYPLIKKAVMENSRIYNEEQVRNEMYLHIGRYVTESSGHNSEYNPWFRKRPDLIKKYCTDGTGWNPGLYAFIRDEYLRTEDTWRDNIKSELSKTMALERGEEYAAYIFNAVFGDNTIFEFNGNVRNFNLIDNLPYGACVEVPVVASKNGLRTAKVGNLPPQCAIITNLNSMCEELAVEGILNKDKTKIFHAIMHDPLTSAVLSLSEIKSMVDEMFAANKDWCEDFR
jgi:alpha-galactosidase